MSSDSFTSFADKVLSSGNFEQAIKELKKLKSADTPVRDCNLLLAICLASIGSKQQAREMLREELLLYPDNDLAKTHLAQFLTEIGTQPIENALSISLACVFETGDSNRIHRSIRSITEQGYPKCQITIADISGKQGIREELAPYNLNYLSMPGQSYEQAMYAAMNHSNGDLMGAFLEYDVFNDSSLFTLSEVFGSLPIYWATTDRSIFTYYGTWERLDFFRQRWTRKIFLNKERLKPPSLLMPFTGVFWKQSLWKEVGSSLDPSFGRAVDTELFTRFFRVHTPFTIGLFVVGRQLQRGEVRDENPSLEYLSSTSRVLFRESKISIDKNIDVSIPPKAVRIAFPNESEVFTNDTVPTLPYSQRVDILVRKDPPRISLVTPSYNQEGFLDECIDSILSQNWPNLEYFILDGGSTDGSVNVIKKYEKHLSYWHSKSDFGAYHAVDEGLRKSSGDIMAWLNSDDKLAPNSLHLIGGIFLDKQSVDWITGRYASITDKGNLEIAGSGIVHTRQTFLAEGYKSTFIQQEGTFWKRSLWKQAGESLDLRWELAADFELWVRFFRFAKCTTVDTALGIFRFQEDQRSQLYRQQYLREAEEISMRERLSGFMPKFDDKIPSEVIREV